MHEVEKIIANLRWEVTRARRFGTVTVNTATVTRLCDEIERLERELELAKQDWTA